MWEEFILVPVAELGSLELTCRKCKAVVLFDVRIHKSLPDSCPMCHDDWNGFTSSLPEAYRGRVHFLEMFGKKDMPMAPKFRVPAQENT